MVLVFLLDTKSKDNKSKNKQVRLHKSIDKKLLYNKENQKQNVKNNLLNGNKYLQMLWPIRFNFQNRQTDQWNKTESPETDPHKHTQLILDKGAKQHNRAKTVPSTNGAGTTGHKDESRHRPYTLHKNQHKLEHPLQSKMQNCNKYPRSQHRRKPRWPWVWWCFFTYKTEDIIHERNNW